ncbi:MAG: methylated-DNA--[protein]-cysteine S-methyltransferase [Bryobacteraceae bacterium]
MRYRTIEPVNGMPLHLTASPRGLRAIRFGISENGALNGDELDPFLEETAAQLTAYFEGRLTRFDLPLDLEGTSFQKRVWNALRAIPYGETISYAQLAEIAGSPKGFRAVGAANGRNPIPIIVPCHRVIQSGGGLGGYSCGLDVKRMLLDLENRYARRG